MKDMLRVIFKPSTLDRDAVRSAYYESVRPTFVTMIITLIAAITFLVLTFAYPPYFGGTTVLYHQICYVWVILIAFIWIIGAHHSLKDYAARYRIVYGLNHFMGVSLYVWVICLMIVNYMARGTVDTTLFMTVALVVPLCVYLNPLAYISVAILSNIAVISFLYYALSQGSIESNELANFIIFAVFEIVMGIIMTYTKFRLNEQLVTAERQRKEIYMLNKSQTTFFSNMSHEIRTPINTIIGLNEMILREDVSDEVVEDAVIIEIFGNRNRKLAFAVRRRSEAGRGQQKDKGSDDDKKDSCDGNKSHSGGKPDRGRQEDHADLSGAARRASEADQAEGAGYGNSGSDIAVDHHDNDLNHCRQYGDRQDKAL